MVKLFSPLPLLVLIKHSITCFFFKMGQSRPLFLYFRLFHTDDSKQMFYINVCRWLDSNRGPLVSEPIERIDHKHNSLFLVWPLKHAALNKTTLKINNKGLHFLHSFAQQMIAPATNHRLLKYYQNLNSSQKVKFYGQQFLPCPFRTLFECWCRKNITVLEHWRLVLLLMRRT